ncbi:class I SAM-dependent methyltransferase [Nonomuraea rubra]|uniref:O-methyltransferase involved in polyketide biosynthesis n=1 Tax=Nonomuraea rubra TaxID=46180 RepID=A0A7X0NTG7_9ACTN|nr:class I SAM-dependent methyltransferase [Nonomuraea rubra]MBB6549323.1 O-methyltransferase involved in polyketide biosynthesis [Nonomuraea rubra]
MEREKVELTTVQGTMLATLYARALDSRARHSILGDHTADEVVRRVDHDWSKTGTQAPWDAATLALRGRELDRWTGEFLIAHPGEVTVLHLACGLDTRVHRLDPPPSVRWVDVDFPDVIELRRRLLPEPGGNYRMLGASVTEEGWLEEVPGDRPVVVVAEGLTMYLHEEEGRQLIQRICGHFPGGELLFDCFSERLVRLAKKLSWMAMGIAPRAVLESWHWGIDDPRELEGWQDGLAFVDDLYVVDVPDLGRLPAAARIGLRLGAHLPGGRDSGRLLRYRF